MLVNATNISQTPSSSIIWNIPASARLIMCIIQVVLNSSMLMVFIFRKELRTSFTIYLMFLFVSNIIYAVGEYPLEVIRHGFPGKWWLPPSACTFYIYQIWVFCPVPMHMHVLITLNRLWAMTFPVSYKNFHSERLAVLLCASMVVYVHLICLPVVILDLLYYRVSEADHGCFLNTTAQSVTTAIVAIVSTDMPFVFIVGAYPFLWRKHRNWKKIGMGNVFKMEISHAMRSPINLTHAPDHIRFQTKTRRSEVTTFRPFLVLTLLTVSVLICWTPDQVSWTVACFTALNDSPDLRYTTSVLYTLQAAFDPILFALSLRKFRDTLFRILCIWKRKA